MSGLPAFDLSPADIYNVSNDPERGHDRGFSTSPNSQWEMRESVLREVRSLILEASGATAMSESLLDNEYAHGGRIDAERLDPLSALQHDSDPRVQRHQAQRVYNVMPYDDGSQFNGTAQNGVDSVPLSRPKGFRIFLIIQNNSSTNNMKFAFDANSVANGLIIRPTESIYFANALPQNDLHVSGVGADCSFAVMFINTDPSAKA